MLIVSDLDHACNADLIQSRIKFSPFLLSVGEQGKGQSVTKPASPDLDLSRVQILKLPPCFDTPPSETGRGRKEGGESEGYKESLSAISTVRKACCQFQFLSWSRGGEREGSCTCRIA